MKPWFQSALEGNIRYLERNVESFAGARDHLSRSAMMFAALNDNDDSVRCLMTWEATLQTDKGMTALMFAAAANSLKSIKLLAKTEVGRTTGDGLTALMHAAAAGNLDAVKMLLPFEGKMQTKSGCTALMLAVAQDHANCAEILLKHEVNIQDHRGLTATMVAVDAVAMDCLYLMLQSGVPEYGVFDDESRTALIHAYMARRSLEERKKNLEAEHYKLEEALLVGAQSSNTSERLVAVRAQIEDCTACTRRIGEAIDLLRPLEEQKIRPGAVTPLMFAAEAGDSLTVSRLIDKQTKNKDAAGMTALMYAARGGHEDIVRMLEPREVGMRDAKGSTAAMYAASAGNLPALNILIPKEYQLMDSKGMNVMHYAAYGGSEAIVSTVIETFKTIADSKGRTSLMFAAQAGHAHICKLLLPYEKGLVDNDRRSALMYAAIYDHPLCVDILIDAEKRLLDTNGSNALLLACSNDGYQTLPALMRMEAGTVKGLQPIFVCAEFDSAKCLRVMFEIASAGYSSLLPQKSFTRAEIAMYTRETKIVTKKYRNLNDGFTPLMVALHCGKSAAAAYLTPIQAGIRAPNGFTPLMMLAQTPDARGLDDNVLNTLVLACKGQTLAKDTEGYHAGTTALMIAVTNASSFDTTRLIKALIPHELTLRNSKGATAMDIAREVHNTKVVGLFADAYGTA